jgi:hypothetical protein
MIELMPHKIRLLALGQRCLSLPQRHSALNRQDLRKARLHLGWKVYHYDTMHYEYRPELL